MILLSAHVTIQEHTTHAVRIVLSRHRKQPKSWHWPNVQRSKTRLAQQVVVCVRCQVTHHSKDHCSKTDELQLDLGVHLPYSRWSHIRRFAYVDLQHLINHKGDDCMVRVCNSCLPAFTLGIALCLCIAEQDMRIVVVHGHLAIRRPACRVAASSSGPEPRHTQCGDIEQIQVIFSQKVRAVCPQPHLVGPTPSCCALHMRVQRIVLFWV